jgi:hypothetical protein
VREYKPFPQTGLYSSEDVNGKGALKMLEVLGGLDWASIVVSIGGAAAAAWIAARLSVKHAQKLFSTENSKEEIIKAIGLAELYADRLIPPLTRIYETYGNIPELQDILKKLNAHRRRGDLQFTYNEMFRIFKESEISLALKIIRDVSDKAGITYEKNTLLNNLEYFSMYFNTNVADSDTVYQSLHQTYLGLVTWLYLDISTRNREPKDHYFTNVILLFNAWNKEYNTQAKAEESVIADHIDGMLAMSHHTEAELENIKKKPMPYKK